jgi:hypothetical protein
MKKWIFLLIICLVAPVSHARVARKPQQVAKALPSWCVINKWPLSRATPLHKVVEQLQTFQGSQRIFLLQWGWGEIAMGKPNHMVAPIFSYLAGTEPNENLREYYDAMGALAQGMVSVEDAMKVWPKRMRLVPVANRLTLAQMCEDYQKALAMKRTPQSNKKTKRAAPVKKTAKKPR